MTFTPAQRATLAAVADVLIPASTGEDVPSASRASDASHLPSASQAGVAGRLPSASQAGVGERWLDEVLNVLPEVREPLEALLLGLGAEDPSAAVARLQRDDPSSFDLLCTVVAGAYFLNPDVRQTIGYPGQQAVPIEVQDPPDYEQDGLLASVIARGPVYRPTPPPKPA